jgi:hypothetical protein
MPFEALHTLVGYQRLSRQSCIAVRGNCLVYMAGNAGDTHSELAYSKLVVVKSATMTLLLISHAQSFLKHIPHDMFLTHELFVGIKVCYERVGRFL